MKFTFRLKYKIFAVLLSFTFLMTGCSSGELSRRQAASMIAGDSRYKTVAETLIDPGMLPNGAAKTWQISKEDSAAEASLRAREEYQKQQPQLFVAARLGFINLYFERPELGGRQFSMPSELYQKNLGVWHFKVRTEMTDAGESLWRDTGYQVNPRTLPLATRGEPEITGVIAEDGVTRRVEFTYRWDPTPLGAALDPENPAFNDLPQNLQQILKNPKPDLFVNNNKTNNFRAKRRGVAYFRKFDDGWRLENMTLL